MLETLVDFVHRLRDASVPVSMVETLDAVESLRHVDASDRTHFKATLAATLVKRAEHREAFEALFEICFRARLAASDAAPPPAGPATPSPTVAAGADRDAEPSEHLLEALLPALRRGDSDTLRLLAARAVREFGGIETQRAGSARYYLYRILRQLDLSALLQRAVRDERAGTGPRSAFDERLGREEQARRLEEFRRLLDEEIRRQLADVRGSHAAVQASSGPPLEDIDFLSASPAELSEMRRAIRPLARALATRIARRRRLRRQGRLDARRTIRRSLSAGGVPLDPAFRRPRVSRPDLCLLCDISGSVGEFATFTLSLLYAMNEEFSRIRSFVFVDGIDEVTAIFARGGPGLDASHLLARAGVVWADGHSDYGHVFERFWAGAGRAALNPKTTIIITGDARNNYRDPGLTAFRAIRERARRIYWLNPEPRNRWDTTDSIMSLYAPSSDRVVEVRNLRQLGDFARSIV